MSYHVPRRNRIMREHPEIKELFAKSPMILVYTMGYVAAMWGIGALAVPLLSSHPLLWAALAYCAGGSLVGGITLLIHECGHRHLFKSDVANRLAGYVGDMGMLLPVSASFRKYHKMHHTTMSVVGIDADLPTEAEAKVFKGKIGKAIWLFLHAVWYAFRPMIVVPGPPTKWEVLGYVCAVASNLVLRYLSGGWLAHAWVFMSVFFGTGIHPTAAHFIVEHFTFPDNPLAVQDTNSYYGFWNLFLFNSGYHTEHHDFPEVPCDKLHTLYEVAYANDPSVAVVPSFIGAQWNFIMDDGVTLKSKVLRDRKGNITRAARDDFYKAQ